MNHAAGRKLLKGGGENVNWFEAIKQKRLTRRESDAPQTETSLKPVFGEPFERLASLTPCEHDLFLLLLEGFTLQESAKQLSVKYSTANTHITGIYKKLKVNSRAELIIRYRDVVKRNE